MQITFNLRIQQSKLLSLLYHAHCQIIYELMICNADRTVHSIKQTPVNCPIQTNPAKYPPKTNRVPNPIILQTIDQSSSASSTLGARCLRVGSAGELIICGAVVVVAEAGDGWPGRAERAAIPPAEEDAACLDFFFFFFFSCGLIVSNDCCSTDIKKLTSCQAQTGLKLSKNPTSSNRFGYSHNPGGTINMVMPNRMSRKIAMTKNRPIRPSIPILRYHTPRRIFMGHSGNMTIANTKASAPAAYSFCLICAPS